jgi:hypothetical protein
MALEKMNEIDHLEDTGVVGLKEMDLKGMVW